jgi:UDP-glucose 4-epimerase
MSIKGKTILVTGGGGYIGGNIVKSLHRADAIPIVVDYKNNIAIKPFTESYNKVDYGVREFYGIAKIHNIDAIVHCAGTSLVGPSMTDPGEYYNNNVAKTINMLNGLRENYKLVPIVFSSSASVYGDPTYVPIDEKHPLRPMSPYGASKLMIERILQDFDIAYNLPHINLRYFNAAGASREIGQAPGATHIIARIFESYINQETFTLNGNDYDTPDGTCVRDYIHVVDLANAHIKALEYLFAHQDERHSINLGTGKGISNLEVANAVEDSLQLPPTTLKEMIKEGPRRPGDPAELVASNKLAKELLGWEPIYDIHDICKSANSWYYHDSAEVAKLLR